MGDAKRRKIEIDTLKQQPKNIEVCAVRYCADGHRQTIGFTVDMKNYIQGPLTKDELLGTICILDWDKIGTYNTTLDNLANLIANYLTYTKSYKEFGTNKCYVICFNELDVVLNAPSCRDVFVTPIGALPDINRKVLNNIDIIKYFKSFTNAFDLYSDLCK